MKPFSFKFRNVKYAVIKNMDDIHDEGVLCIFTNARQREQMELLARKEVAKTVWKQNNYIRFEYMPLLTKDAKKFLAVDNLYHIWDYRPNQENTSVKEWYVMTYPTDELGAEIPSELTFEQVFDALDNYKDVYKLLDSAADSLVRERIFDRLTQIMHCSYRYIYDQWIKCED